MRENVYHLFSWTGPQPEQPTTKSKQSYFQIMKRNESTGKKEKQLVYKPLVVLKLRVIISGQSRWAMIKLTKIYSFLKLLYFGKVSWVSLQRLAQPIFFSDPKAKVRFENWYSGPLKIEKMNFFRKPKNDFETKSFKNGSMNVHEINCQIQTNHCFARVCWRTFL